MWVSRKIWRALMSCYHGFEIHIFALLPANYCFCLDLIVEQQLR